MMGEMGDLEGPETKTGKGKCDFFSCPCFDNDRGAKVGRRDGEKKNFGMAAETDKVETAGAVLSVLSVGIEIALYIAQDVTGGRKFRTMRVW